MGPQFSSVVAPLTDLTVKGVKWRWGSKEQAAFEAGRDALVTSTAVYRPDYNIPIRVQTDASEHGVDSRTYVVSTNSSQNLATSASTAVN